MATKDDELQKLAEERDGLQLSLEQARRALAESIPEAGASLSFQVIPGKVVGNFQVTLRATHSTQIGELIETGAKLIQERGWHMVEPPPTAPPPAPSAASEAVKDGTPEVKAAVKAVVEGVGDPPAGKEWQTTDVQEIHIEPKADGMVLVEFWIPGRKWAEEYVKWQPAHVLGLLKHVMTVPVNNDGSIKTAKVTCPCRVYYTLGKEKTGPNAKPGSRWHDVAHVRLIP